MTKFLRISMIMLLITLLGACGTNRNHDNTTTTNKATETTTTTPTTPTTNETVTNETTTTPTTTGTTEHKLELADDVADKIAKMKDVERAHVIVTNNNAYVGVELKKGVNASKELEDKIADEVRAEKNFKNVYVSTNPDFAKEFAGYREKITANEPVEGFFEQFTATVNRVFPHAH